MGGRYAGGEGVTSGAVKCADAGQLTRRSQELDYAVLRFPPMATNRISTHLPRAAAILLSMVRE